MSTDVIEFLWLNSFFCNESLTREVSIMLRKITCIVKRYAGRLKVSFHSGAQWDFLIEVQLQRDI